MIQPMIPKQAPWSRRGKLVKAALAATVALSLTAIVATTIGGAGSTDHLSATEMAQRTAAFTSTITLPLVTGPDRDAAIGTMALPLGAQANLKADIEAGRTGLVWLSLWDDKAADGDRVRISAGGFNLDLDLYKAPHRIGIPINGGAGDLVITGLRDGGGGITLGLQTTDDVMLTPVIQPGQILSMRLR